MKLKKRTEMTVTVEEILNLIRERAIMVVIPEKVSVLPLHGKEPQVGHAGEFSAIRISWEES